MLVPSALSRRLKARPAVAVAWVLKTVCSTWHMVQRRLETLVSVPSGIPAGPVAVVWASLSR